MVMMRCAVPGSSSAITSTRARSAPAPAAADELDPQRVITFAPEGRRTCAHVADVREVHPSARGCEECLRTGARWVHLRICMTCGHVGCCDSSPGRHAHAHFHESRHPIIRSAEPGERWGWCYEDRVQL